MTEVRRLFHEELDEINAEVLRLGAVVGEAIEAGTDALLACDLAGVEQVVADDHRADALTDDIESRTYLLLARQQPMAVDLRVLVTVLRVSHEIERIGDLMVRVAKATRRLYPRSLEPRTRGLIDRMRQQATAQLRLAMEAFADRDPSRAAALVDMDDVMDDLQKDLFQAIFAGGAADEVAVQRAVQVALIGRYFERAGDHAANIAERVGFMVHGRFHRHDAEPEPADQPPAAATATEPPFRP